ncbi:MAG: gamma-aminobutyrate permease, partial [Micrococcus sp.]|nr:gamma-aminobutyrate permease [Micrococcus sp.]
MGTTAPSASSAAPPPSSSTGPSAGPDDVGSTHSGLRRTLAPRHLTMIAMGGAIGTGLFVASGNTIATAGPGGALL